MTKKQRKILEQLQRRRDHLANRIRDYRGSNDSYDRAECSALGYAIRIIEAAHQEGVLEDLEQVALFARGRP